VNRIESNRLAGSDQGQNRFASQATESIGCQDFSGREAGIWSDLQQGARDVNYRTMRPSSAILPWKIKKKQKI
jgi:hypothetical protein